MIAFLLTFINVFLLFIGIYTVVKKISTGDSKPLLLLTSVVILFIVISLFYYPMLVLNQSFIRLQLLILIINLAHIYFTKNTLHDIFKDRSFSSANLNSLWALGAVLFLTIYFALYASKYGSWDAWAIWNLHAKFLYHTQHWHQMLSGSLAYSHLDYPLMVPSVVAFFWNGFGSMSPLVPVMLSYGLLLIIPLLIYFSLLGEGNRLFACIAMTIFIIDNNFKMIALSQCADTLLSLLILLTFIQHQNLKTNAANRVYILGFICVSCAWVKNEGLVFYILFTIGFLLVNYKNIQTLKKYFIGMIIPALVVVYFKLFLSPANDLISANNKQLSSLTTVLYDTGRYATILKFGINTLIDNYMAALILIFVVIILNRKAFLSLPFIVISVLLAAYFIIYLITPHDLSWHLSTSLYRVFQQVYPASIYLLFLSLKNVKSPFYFSGSLV